MAKNSMLHIRVSDSYLEKIKNFAESQGMSQSEFCLSAILAAIGEDQKALIENFLTRLAKLEKTVYQNQQVA